MSSNHIFGLIPLYRQSSSDTAGRQWANCDLLAASIAQYPSKIPYNLKNPTDDFPLGVCLNGGPMAFGRT